MAKIIAILPGTPYTVQPLQNGRIRKGLLSQTITLALNIYIPANPVKSVGTISLAGAGGKYLITRDKVSNFSCASPSPATCLLQPGSLHSYMMPANIIAALPANPHISDLLQLAKNALAAKSLPDSHYRASTVQLI